MLTRREIEVLRLREEKDLTQIEVAEELDISQAAVSTFERNAKDKIRKAKKVVEFADELGVEVDDEPIL